ncbi:MAG: hypothetical protein LBO06_08065 [Bacteroidales bacterium]|jgi:hypothetical protein|nr:hypothetical protein [Bacteroidales bacterium]
MKNIVLILCALSVFCTLSPIFIAKKYLKYLLKFKEDKINLVYEKSCKMHHVIDKCFLWYIVLSVVLIALSICYGIWTDRVVFVAFLAPAFFGLSSFYQYIEKKLK